MGSKTKSSDEPEHSETLDKDSEAREELIASAVKFLKDPKVQKSTLNKKVEFLESKGLTPYEIQAALSRSASKKSSKNDDFFEEELSTESSDKNFNHTPQPQYPYSPQVVQASSTWKDYFITSVVFGAVSYSLYGLAQTFIAPLLKWPSEEDLELERKRLDEQFDKAFQAIESVKKETQTVIEAVYSQNTTIEKTLTGLADAIESLKEQDHTRLVDVDKLWTEMESVKKMIPEAFNKSKESQTSLLDDLQNEIRSLKALVGRRAATPSLTASNSLPTSPGSVSSQQSAMDTLYTGNTLRSNSHSSLLTTSFQARDEVASGPSQQHIKPSVPSWQLALNSKSSAPNVPKALSQGSVNQKIDVSANVSTSPSEQLDDKIPESLSPNASQGIASTSI